MNTSTLDRTLRRANRAKMLADVVRAAAMGVAALLGAAALAVAVDALLALGVTGRMIANAMLGAMLLGAVALLLRGAWRNRYDARRVARYVEQRAGVRDSRLINAVDLASQSGAGSAALRRLAIESGDRAAMAVEPRRVVDRRPMRRAALTAGAAALAVGVLALLMPRVFAMVLPRYLDPAGDHPPFTLVDFDVTTSPDKLYRGRPATIRAALSGFVVPQDAAVVFTDEPAATDAERRVAMLPLGDGVFELHIDRATTERTFYIDTPHGRSKRHTLRVLPIPTFEQALVRYEYPTYTGWEPGERSLSDAGIEAIIGTRVTVSVDSNMPLRSGRLRVAPDGAGEAVDVTLAPAAERPSNVAGSFTLERSGTYELSLESAEGVPSDAAPGGPVIVRIDEAPRIQLLEPDLRVTAPVGWKVRASWSAADDVAVDRIFYYETINDGAIASRELRAEHTGRARATAGHTLDLEAMGAKAGDVIRGFATVTDNRPPTPQRADSPTFEVRVVSEAEYAERARQQVHAEDVAAEFAEMMEAMAALDAARAELAERAEALKGKVAAGATLTEAERAELDELRSKLAEFADAAEQLAETMKERAERPALYEFEKPVREQMAELAASLAAEAAQMRSHHDRLPPPTEQKVADLLRDLKANAERAESDRREAEETAEQLEKLAMADRLMAAAAELMAIAEAQRDVERRIAEAQSRANALDPAHRERMAELAREQEALASRLEEALGTLSDAVEEAEHALPKMSASADDLVRTIGEELKVGRDQREAAERAQLGDAAGAQAAADAAATKLESLITTQMQQGMSGAMSQDLDGALGLTRGQMLSAASQMMSGRQPQRGPMGSSSPGGEGRGGETMLGPHSPQRSSGASELSRTRQDADAFSQANRGSPRPAGDTAQRLEPEARPGDRTAPGDADAAPARYRPLIDAYFKRLADDAR